MSTQEAEGGEDLSEMEVGFLEKLFGAKPPSNLSPMDLKLWVAGLATGPSSGVGQSSSSSTVDSPQVSSPSSMPIVSGGVAGLFPTSSLSSVSAQTPAHVVSPPSSASVPVINISNRKPWLSKFGSGEGYELWRHQLMCLRPHYSAQDVADVIRSSLHGKAGELLITLGPSASVDDIVAKLDSVFGQVDDDTDVKAAFYSARQGQRESVADWSCRIEGLFARVSRVSNITGTEEGLRQMFWTGLRQELKTATTYYYETVKSFDQLRKAVRRVEQQQQPVSAPKVEKASCHVAQGEAKANTDSTQRLEAMVKQLTTDMKAMQAELKAQRSQQRHEQPTTQNQQGSQREVKCFRCGELGHVRAGCRVNIDHLRRPPQDFHH
jgi:hypothetical protein